MAVALQFSHEFVFEIECQCKVCTSMYSRKSSQCDMNLVNPHSHSTIFLEPWDSTRYHSMFSGEFMSPNVEKFRLKVSVIYSHSSMQL